MVNKPATHRSINERYTPQIIKEYRHWTLCIHEDQRYLGRCYAWLVREGDMQRFSQLYTYELIELHIISKELERALRVLWKPDHMNNVMLGNHFHEHAGHAHMHMIPRYMKPRSFNGWEYEDQRWGKNYAPCEPFKPEPVELFAIRDAIKDALSL